MSTRSLKVGGVDDPIWDEPASPAQPSRPSRHPTVGSAVLVAIGGLAIIGITWLVWPGNPSDGDPGGLVMRQLTPSARALPGDGTASLPWVRNIPSSLDASYIIKIEPFPDSCDGIPGSQGWSPVAVQSRFHWSDGLAGLTAFMDPRLSELGWTPLPEAPPANSPAASWTKTLTNGTRANLDVTEEGGPTSTVWQADASAPPVGKAASC